MKEAGVGQEAHTGGLCGVDDGLVLGDALADSVSGDQQETVDTGEGVGEGVSLVVVEGADLDALLSQVSGLLRVAGEGDEVAGVGAGEQCLGDVCTELSGGSGECDGHGMVLCCGAF